MKQGIWILALIFLIAGCGGNEVQQQNIGKENVPDFEYTDQDGETFSSSELEGKVWLADFIFTSCTTVCPPMTAHMTNLQKKFKEQGVPIQIVSFSVDPQRDDPEALKTFAEQYDNIDFSQWHFLTGYKFEEIKRLAESAFAAPVAKPPEDSDQFLHSTAFYLVNQEGNVIKRYSGNEEVPFEQIIDDVQALQN